jgi:PAS domain S-box-containing protein
MWRIPPDVLESGDDEKATAFAGEQLRAPEQFRRKIQQVYAQPDVESFDVLEFKDGRVFERYSIPQMLDGEPVGRVWSFRDVTGRRRAEAALRESEASFRLLFANHPMPMWVYDLQDLRFLEVNQSAVEHYGYSRDELLAMRITDLAPEATLRAIRPPPVSSPEHSRESKHRRKDGSVIDVHVVSHVLEFAGRRAALVQAQDITERKRAVEALRLSEEKHRAILEGMDEGYYEVDLGANLTFFNDALCRSLGYSREELQGLDASTLTDDENTRKVREAFRLVRETGRPLKNAEFQVIAKDGSRRDVQASMALMRDAKGDPQGFRGVVIDVSERRQAEEALRESEERYRRLVEMSPDGIAIHQEGKVVFVNPSACRTMGASDPRTSSAGRCWSSSTPNTTPSCASAWRCSSAGRRCRSSRRRCCASTALPWTSKGRPCPSPTTTGPRCRSSCATSPPASGRRSCSARCTASRRSAPPSRTCPASTRASTRS